MKKYLVLGLFFTLIIGGLSGCGEKHKQEGDVVEVAYFKDYPQTYKIAWKHDRNNPKVVAVVS